jgi:cob(I)alamin adenosyltransferase
MAKIYTKGGDKGTTQFLSGKRVPKYHIRIEAYGNIDELTSYVGLLRSFDLSQQIKQQLLEIQQVLFNISGLLACDEGKHLKLLTQIKETDIQHLEQAIDQMTAELEPLRKFIIPGGQQQVAYAHICRTIARRAERSIVKLSDSEKIDQHIIIYINRLSDYFFTLSRFIAKLKNFKQNYAN